MRRLCCDWLTFVQMFYQLQGGQQVLGGFKVVQTVNDGGQRPAAADTTQRSRDAISVIMDVESWTLLLEK